MILIDDTRRDRPPILAMRCRRHVGRGLNIGFDEGSPGPINPGLLVDHAELLPLGLGVPSQAGCRPPDPSNAGDHRKTLPGLACLAHSRSQAGQA